MNKFLEKPVDKCFRENTHRRTQLPTQSGCLSTDESTPSFLSKRVAGRFELKPEELRQRKDLQPPRWLALNRAVGARRPQAWVPVGAPELTVFETGGQGRERVHPVTLPFLDREMPVGPRPRGKGAWDTVLSVVCRVLPGAFLLHSVPPPVPAARPAARPAQASPSLPAAARATLTHPGPSRPLGWVRACDHVVSERVA